MTVVAEQLSDSDLLVRFAAGEQSAFDMLAVRHRDWIYSVAFRRTRDAAMASDVTQGVLISLLQKAARLSRHPSLTSWLFRATRYAASTLLRAERRRKRQEERAMHAKSTWGPGGDGGESDSEWAELEPFLDDAVGRLSEKDRRAILLRFYRKLSHPEIAAKLGISEEAARKRVDRALERLRKRMGSAMGLGAMLAAWVVMAAPRGTASGTGLIALDASPRAMAAAKSVHTMEAMMKIKVAAVMMVAVLAAMGAELLAREIARAPGTVRTGTPVAAASAPAAAMPLATADLRDIHAVTRRIYETIGDAPESLAMRNFFDTQRGTLDTRYFKNAAINSRDDGTHRYRYRDNAILMTQDSSEHNAAFIAGYLPGLVGAYRGHLGPRRVEMDMKVQGETLACYEFLEQAAPGAVSTHQMFTWLDVKGLPRRMKNVSTDPVLGRVRTQRVELEFNEPAAADTWDLPKQVKLIDPAAELLRAFPIEKTMFTREVLGQRVTVHSFSRAVDGTLMLVVSTQLTGEARTKLEAAGPSGKTSLDRAMEFFVNPAKADGSTDTQADYRVEPVAAFYAAGVKVEWDVLLPLRAAPRTNRVRFDIAPREASADPVVSPSWESVSFDLKDATDGELVGMVAEVFSGAEKFEGLVRVDLFSLQVAPAGNVTRIADSPFNWTKEAYVENLKKRLEENRVKYNKESTDR